MPFLPYLALLRQELTAFSACLDHDVLDAPVPHCGDWRLRDLAEHVARGNHWVATAVTERHGNDVGPPPPEPDAAIRPWFDASAEALLTTLDTDPEKEAWTFTPPHTVGFWQRRRAQETLIHRWDAQHALGRPYPLDPEFAADGVAEVFDTFVPRQMRRGRLIPRRLALGLRATDVEQDWILGPDHPVAEVAGPAERLLLLLWKRVPAEDRSLTWSGDRSAGLTVLDGALTP